MFTTNVIIYTRLRFDSKFLKPKFLKFSTIGLMCFQKIQQFKYIYIYAEVTHELVQYIKYKSWWLVKLIAKKDPLTFMISFISMLCLILIKSFNKYKTSLMATHLVVLLTWGQPLKLTKKDFTTLTLIWHPFFKFNIWNSSSRES
jgi:hypothetical protein